MKVFLIFFLISSVAVISELLPNFDLTTQVEEARNRFNNDFLLGVWYRSNEAIVESRENLLNLYTRYTIQQAAQVIDHVEKYKNLTKMESLKRREDVLAGKNVTEILKMTDCIFKNEDDTIQAYKITGYNLHNCIRMAQIETETKYLDIIKNFEHIKNVSLVLNEYFSNKVDNCLDKTCIMNSLIQSVIHYEKLQEEISTNVTEINSINMKYLLSHIALGCVSNSMAQIEQNYNIGKNLVGNCFESEPLSEPRQENIQENSDK